MKKLFLSAAALIMLQHSYGQDPTTNTTTTTTTTTTPTESVAPAQPGGNENNSGKEFTHFYIGARGMATLSSLRIKNINNSTVATDFIVGYGGGGVLGTNFSKNIGAQVEVLYSQLAQKFKDDNGIQKSLHVNYLNIPLMIVLNTDVSRAVNLNVCAGPQLGINTGSSLKTESSNSENPDTVHAVLAVKTGDFGFAYGIGLDFMLAPSLKLSLGYRGVQGLIDVSDQSKSKTTNDYYILDRAHVNTYSGYAGLALCF